MRLVSLSHRDDRRTDANSGGAVSAVDERPHCRGRPERRARERRAHTHVVPLNARGRTFGAMSLGWDTDERHDDESEVEFALDIARRAAIAIDNAQLYGAAAERAQAARVLASVGDGVFFVDRAGVIRTWNRAAAIATGLARPTSSTGPQSRRSRAGRRSLAHRGRDRGQRRAAARVAAARPRRPRALALDPRRRGSRRCRLRVPRPHRGACARAMRTEFVSTVSHELRTPLAAIYGAAMTLRRSDVVDRRRAAHAAARHRLGRGRPARAHRQRHPLGEPPRHRHPERHDPELRSAGARRPRW